MLIELSWKEVLFLIVLLEVGVSLSLRPLTLMTMEGSFDLPAQCAYADDLAVASSSLRELMYALAPAFRSVDYTAGLHLNVRKCCWVQYGNEEHDSLRTWISENCEEFRDMQIVRHAKYVVIVGLHSEKIVQRVMKIDTFSNSLVERLCDLKICAISVLSFIGYVCAPDKATLKAENHALQCTTAGPYYPL